MSCVLACDFGGSTLRAALIDDEGRTIIKRACAAPLPGGEEPAAEIDPAQWFNALNRLAHELAAGADAAFAGAAAIAICGITATQVFLDGRGRVVRPAMTWRDRRADQAAQRLRERLKPCHPDRATVSAFHPAARLAWLQENEPHSFDLLSSVFEPKDYLNYRLTGEVATDAISSARLAATQEMVISRNLVPPRLDPLDVVGKVRADLTGALSRLAGRPVLCMTNDTWAAVLGMGGLRARLGYNISGTTEVFGVISATAGRARGLLTNDWTRGLHQIGGPSQSGADTANWLLTLLAHGEVGNGALARLLGVARRGEPVIFLPYLQGERTPHWDARLRGAFLGLSRNHGPGDLAWAVLEGVAFLNRMVLERAETAAGFAVDEIRLGGGASANPVWCQTKSDVCERPVSVSAASEPGLLGAAMAAWTALGRFRDLEEAQHTLSTCKHRYTPRPEAQSRYRSLYRHFERANELLHDLHREMSTDPLLKRDHNQ